MADYTDPSLAEVYSIPPRINPKDNPPRYLIGGKILEGPGRPVISKVAREPLVIGAEAQLTEKEALLAVEAVDRAWAGPWPVLPDEARVAAVEKFALRVEASTDRIATLLMFEIGKAQGSARDEVARSVDYIRNTLVEFRKLQEGSKRTFSGMHGKNTHYARELRRPLGRVLCVAPFNYPINEFLTTIVPALLMGNVVIAKTPRFGTLANQALLEAFAECFPPGVVNLLPGDGRVVLPAVMAASEKDAVGNPSGKIDVLAFIGSEGAANAILRAHPAPISLYKILGLGAKNPAIVLDGADYDAVATAITKGALGFNGQRCTAEKIVYAPSATAETLAKKIADRVAALKLGMPWEEGVAITPLPEDKKLESMWALLDDATSKGARVVNVGGGKGFFSIMRPAVVFPVDERMRLFHEEQFGPIVPIAPYDDIAQVIAWQKASPFGQQAGVWGPVEAARPVVEAMGRLVARVNLNDVCQRGPDSFGFTATDKSGFGTLSLRDALLSFSRPLTLQSQDETAVRVL